MTRARRGGARRGFTLVEAMCASALLAISVVAVAGVMAESYNQDRTAQEQRFGMELATHLMEELSSLPLDSTDGSPCLANYSAFSDFAPATSIDSNGTTLPTATSSAGTSTVRGYTRRVSIERRNTPNGSINSTGDLALVTVQVTTPTGKTVTVKRMIAAADRGMND